jgi:leucyl aminopeptidase
MEISVIYGNIDQAQGEALVLGYYEESGNPEGDLAAVDQILDGVIVDLITRGEIKGKTREITTIYTFGKLTVPKVVIAGLGKKADLTPEKIRTAVAETCRTLRQKNAERITLTAIGMDAGKLNAETVGQAIAEGALLGNYTFRRHMTKEPESKDLQQLNIITSVPDMETALGQGCRNGRIRAEATILARDLGNEPGNFMNPANMAETAAKLAKDYNLGIKVIEKDEMQELGMGGLLGVSQGSQQPPRFIVLNYQGKETDDIDIALVGKGITFDSGGISIKPSENMGEMKGDMAGGAAVMAAISAVAQMKPKINVTAIIPATENLPSGSAMKPGDVITILNGKTVEIISTDAEGRLILADALSYAVKSGARRIVDVATLTGACHVALGDYCTGVFGNNQELIDNIIAAGKETGECMWQMPMNDEYREQNKSDVADIKNTGGRYGGAITAAWFLREFVDNIPWVHLDIAGTSTIDKDRGYLIKGNTGIPTRTLISLVIGLAEKE